LDNDLRIIPDEGRVSWLGKEELEKLRDVQDINYPLSIM
jgi:hypothetical protein